METTPEQAAEGIVVVRVLSAVLERLVSANTTISLSDPGQVTKFHALKAPGIGILQYLERIHKYASCSNECFILALIYIDRLIQRNNFLLTELNVHRVVITAILLAAKFFDDAYYNNAYYAKVGGVLVSEMNGLEVDFLFRINFSLHVTPELFHKYREELVSHSGGAISHCHQEVIPAIPACQAQVIGQQLSSPTMPQPVAMAQEFDAGFVVPPQSHAVPGYSSEGPTKRQATYITPSPPDTSAKNPTLQLSGSEMVACAPVPEVPQATNDPFLSGAKPIQLPPFPIAQPRRCSPHAYPVPTMVPMVSDATSVVAASRDDQHFVVIDNMAFPLHHPPLVTPNLAVDVKVGPVIQQRPLAYAPGDAIYTAAHHYFVGSHLLTGCPTGS
uniref:Cyclin n=1 Tax=Cyclophora tenuis TaxID=216820 RepID=A0A7S1GM66_CYCTE|mmetsp:Transcript_22375/g.38068  ORF Transcript_22375/g.38068 Transcript_22375/m.38068 type:complete len:387 (+) Transcript_22375:285-1445(+)|eukprot:CAMPEP_0116554990 /NCGR_PEP_ID=MMETSP0397-20121206/7895_1 /TAXON_ID=216820 /ORGANISM="Cyclophora tenuis, Strain ECT3854" /LENGTH=386 /DNA_ID=CAMNT_0004080205 /DNA_START=260 /DNA_END=1420 /DNA_ORIENTATION=+